MTAARLVFDTEVSLDQFSEFSERQGWENVADDDPDLDEDRETSQWEAGNGNTVRFIDDSVVECQYVDFNGDDTSDLEELVRGSFTARNFTETMDDVDFEHPAEAVRQELRRLACAAPTDPDDRAVGIFTAAVQDPRSDVRFGALAIPYLTEWAECLPGVIELAENDQDDGVRSIARSTRVMLE